jgi:CheY-like chemotaxis protein
LGCEVETADSGVKAVTLALDTSFDLVLMDCYMPGMDGLMATYEIRRQEGPQRRVPIIALTASSPQEREHCLAAGMDDFLEKPVTVEKIEMLFQRWVEVADSSLPAD